MSWADDRWRGSYDAWKLASPDDEYGDDTAPEDECEHEDYDHDILTGIATCNMCEHRWHMTEAEIKRDQELAGAYDQQCREWEAQNQREADEAETTPAVIDDEVPF